MDLYKEYIKERENADIIIKGDGFLKYNIINGICLVADIFVREESRNILVTQMMREVTSIAKESGCLLLEAHVHLNTNNPELSLKACLAFGFKPIEANLNIIYMTKEI